MNKFLKALKSIGKALLWCAAAVLLVILALFGINAVDEDLRPEVAAALQAAKPAVPDKDNAFFAIIGLTAPAGVDPREHGRRWYAELSGATDAGQARAIDQKYGKNSLEFAGGQGSYCSPRSEDCFHKAVQNPEQVRKVHAANQELMQRYEVLLGYPGFEDRDPPRIAESIPTFWPLLNAQSLKHAEIALLIDAGRMDDGLAALERVTAMDRRIFAGSSSLISKMIGLNVLSRDLLFLAEVLRAKPGELGPYAERIKALAAPLNAEERRMDRVFAGEFKFAAASMRVFRTGGYGDTLGFKLGLVDLLRGFDRIDISDSGRYAALDPLLIRFLNDNATLNLNGPYYARLGELARLPPAELTAAYRALAQQAKDQAFNWRMLYNPVGKWIFVTNAKADWDEYSLRNHDLDGLARLVALQAGLLAAGVADAGVPSYLATSDPKLFDPYSGKPMQWDAAARQLWFTPRSKGSRLFKIGGREDRVAVAL